MLRLFVSCNPYTRDSMAIQEKKASFSQLIGIILLGALAGALITSLHWLSMLKRSLGAMNPEQFHFLNEKGEEPLP